MLARILLLLSLLASAPAHGDSAFETSSPNAESGGSFGFAVALIDVVDGDTAVGLGPNRSFREPRYGARTIFRASDFESLANGDAVDATGLDGGRDLDGDGRPDWVVGASNRGASSGGSVLGFSGGILPAFPAVALPARILLVVALTLGFCVSLRRASRSRR